ncbi:MAG: hypothetical protein CYPHOPRED_001927 [Cyphobasidiales sp. Tagirdzhanova-0007]|nr:MAG: hypothetical protein CYPHOPRED_001927 [Cyphobasidiales sp. Tagirdzhanova-0007]
MKISAVCAVLSGLVGSSLSAPLYKRLFVPAGTSNNGPAAFLDPNPSFFSHFSDPSITPEPIRGAAGANILSGTDVPLDRQNPDALARPSTDIGSVENGKWSFSLSSNRIKNGGWARQVVNAEGQKYVQTINTGNLWYYPEGTPHNLQAQDPVLGAENLLVFDDGSFDEDDTFAITDWTAHIPKKVLNKNFGFAADSHAFDDIPATELYTFEGPNPPPLAEQMIKDPNGTSTLSYGLAFSQVPFINVPFGQYKIASAETNFPIATTVAAAEVILEPGSMRELHWHPNSDEWDYFIAGEIRATVFASGTNSRTFNFQADDVGYIPVEGHSDHPVPISGFKSSTVEVFSLAAWIAHTPRHIIQDALRLSNDTINSFRKEASFIVPGSLAQS